MTDTNSSKNRGHRMRQRLAAIAFSLTLVITACGGDDGAAPTTSEAPDRSTTTAPATRPAPAPTVLGADSGPSGAPLAPGERYTAPGFEGQGLSFAGAQVLAVVDLVGEYVALGAADEDPSTCVALCNRIVFWADPALGTGIDPESLRPSGRVAMPDRLDDWIPSVAGLVAGETGTEMIAGVEVPWWEVTVADDTPQRCPMGEPCAWFASWGVNQDYSLDAAMTHRIHVFPRATSTVVVLVSTEDPTPEWTSAVTDVLASIEFDA